MPILTRVLPAALLVFSLQIPTPNPTPQAPAAGTGVVAGQVVDATTGKPIAGAVVILAVGAPPPLNPTGGVPPAPSAANRRGVAVANAEGRFVFRDVPPGSFSLISTLEGYAAGATGRRRPNGPGRTFTLTDGGRITDARLEMWRLSTISGVVRDDRGEPAIGVSVTAMRRVLNGGRYELTFTGGSGEATDERGYYRIHGLMPGSYVLVIRTIVQTMSAPSADAYRAAVTSGTTAVITSQYRATGAVQVTGRGLNLGDWIVSTISGDHRVLPGPNGTVLMPPPMIYYPSARTAPEATVVTLGPGEDRAGADMTLPLLAGVRVSGVLMGPDGPAPNHGVHLIPAVDGEPAYENPVAYAVTDASGRFAVVGVAPGNYILKSYRVTPVGMAGLRFDPPAAGTLSTITVEQTQPAVTPSLFAQLPIAVGSAHVDNLAFTLQPGARISGRVIVDAVTPAGAKPPRVVISITSLAGYIPGSTQAAVDASGQFSFMGFAPGRYVLMPSVAAPATSLSLASILTGGVDIADKILTLGTTDISDVVVTLTDKESFVSGTVRTSDAKTEPDGTVVLYPVDVQGWVKTGMSPRRMATAPASASGAYRMSVPLPGDYMLVAVPPEIDVEVNADFVKRFGASAVRVSIALGESKTQDLTLARIK